MEGGGSQIRSLHTAPARPCRSLDLIERNILRSRALSEGDVSITKRLLMFAVPAAVAVVGIASMHGTTATVSAISLESRAPPTALSSATAAMDVNLFRNLARQVNPVVVHDAAIFRARNSSHCVSASASVNWKAAPNWRSMSDRRESREPLRKNCRVCSIPRLSIGKLTNDPAIG
jgi:hypothetical protein